jgi:HSP20 family protein
MTMASQPEQTIPVQLHRAQGRLVLAAPMPGLEPQDISVRIHHGRVTIRGEYRDLSLPQPVSGELTNATYGNGVLVLAMPTLEPGVQEDATEFRLEADTGTRGRRVGHIGSEIEPAIPTENRPQNEWAVDNK